MIPVLDIKYQLVPAVWVGCVT